MRLNGLIRNGQMVIATITVAMLAGFAAAAGAEPRLAVLPSQDLVRDVNAKLVWARCVEGMQWNGKTCTGTPVVVSRAGAMSLALTRGKADGKPWRVPQMAELRGLMRASPGPAPFDAKMFPGLPAGWAWSSTSNVNGAPVNPYNYDNIAAGRSADNANLKALRTGWAVHLGTGNANGDFNKRALMFVWLVHSN